VRICLQPCVVSPPRGAKKKRRPPGRSKLTLEGGPFAPAGRFDLIIDIFPSFRDGRVEERAVGAVDLPIDPGLPQSWAFTCRTAVQSPLSAMPPVPSCETACATQIAVFGNDLRSGLDLCPRPAHGHDNGPGTNVGPSAPRMRCCPRCACWTPVMGLARRRLSAKSALVRGEAAGCLRSRWLVARRACGKRASLQVRPAGVPCLPHESGISAPNRPRPSSTGDRLSSCAFIIIHPRAALCWRYLASRWRLQSDTHSAARTTHSPFRGAERARSTRRCDGFMSPKAPCHRAVVDVGTPWQCKPLLSSPIDKF